MNRNLEQTLATSALILHAERLCSSGWLPEKDESELRRLICLTLRAHGLPSMAERRDADVIPFPGSETGAFS